MLLTGLMKISCTSAICTIHNMLCCPFSSVTVLIGE